jgi:hypothetical protein
VRGTRYKVQGARYGAQVTGHVVRDTRYSMWYVIHGTGHSKAQMNNKDIIFVGAIKYTLQ